MSRRRRAISLFWFRFRWMLSSFCCYFVNSADEFKYRTRAKQRFQFGQWPRRASVDYIKRQIPEIVEYFQCGKKHDFSLKVNENAPITGSIHANSRISGADLHFLEEQPLHSNFQHGLIFVGIVINSLSNERRFRTAVTFISILERRLKETHPFVIISRVQIFELICKMVKFSSAIEWPSLTIKSFKLI